MKVLFLNTGMAYANDVMWQLQVVTWNSLYNPVLTGWIPTVVEAAKLHTKAVTWRPCVFPGLVIVMALWRYCMCEMFNDSDPLDWKLWEFVTQLSSLSAVYQCWLTEQQVYERLKHTWLASLLYTSAGWLNSKLWETEARLTSLSAVYQCWLT